MMLVWKHIQITREIVMSVVNKLLLNCVNGAVLKTFILFTISAFVYGADEQFKIGQEKAKVCMTCHGADGIAHIDAYPNLRGQNKGYLISSLKSYRARERSGGLAVLMQQQADALSDQDIEDIAHFYSTLGNSSHP